MAADADGTVSDGAPELMALEAQIADARAKVAAAANALQRQLTEAAGWRGWVRRKPVHALAVAFALGAMLGRRPR